MPRRGAQQLGGRIVARRLAEVAPELQLRRRVEPGLDELAGAQDAVPAAAQGGGILLSTIERILFLKEVPFFQGMTIEQLRVLATVCEEDMFAAEQHIFREGDPGGALYCVVSGRVVLEQPVT